MAEHRYSALNRAGLQSLTWYVVSPRNHSDHYGLQSWNWYMVTTQNHSKKVKVTVAYSKKQDQNWLVLPLHWIRAIQFTKIHWKRLDENNWMQHCQHFSHLSWIYLWYSSTSIHIVWDQTTFMLLCFYSAPYVFLCNWCSHQTIFICIQLCPCLINVMYFNQLLGAACIQIWSKCLNTGKYQKKWF